MGILNWFKKEPPKKDGEFIISKEGDTMPDRYYGYWCVRWSVDNAIGLLNNIREIPEESSSGKSLIAMIKARQRMTFFQLEAFYIAIYLTYAKNILNVSQATISEMEIGLRDGLKDLNGPDDVPIDDEMQLYLIARISEYQYAIVNDINVEPQLGVLNFEGGKAFKALMKNITSMYITDSCLPETFSSLEQIHLLRLIDNVPVRFMVLLRDNIGISYRHGA